MNMYQENSPAWFVIMNIGKLVDPYTTLISTVLAYWMYIQFVILIYMYIFVEYIDNKGAFTKNIIINFHN